MEEILLVQPSTKVTQVKVQTISTIITAPDPVNLPPISNAGSDVVIKDPVEELTLSGSSSRDPEGLILKYEWTQLQGPSAVVFVTPTGATCIVKNIKALGNYVFNLRVTDPSGLATSDSVAVLKKESDIVVPPPASFLTLKLQAPIAIAGQSNLVYEGFRVENAPAEALYLRGCKNVIIRNCFFNRSAAESIVLENCYNVLVESVLFSRSTCGVYALGCNDVRVLDCQGVNFRRRDNWARGQLAQFNGCGGTLNEVLNCRAENFANESDPEDVVSIYRSHNVNVKNNIFRGGGANDNGTREGGPSDSGSGIMSGDNGGTNQVVENNILINTGNAGIGIAGGVNIKVLSNKIYSEKTSVSNNPLYAWAQAGQEGQSNNAVAKDNQVYWTHKTGYINDGWNAGNISNVTWQNNVRNTNILAQANVPSHLITKVTAADLLKIRGKY